MLEVEADFTVPCNEFMTNAFLPESSLTLQPMIRILAEKSTRPSQVIVED